MERILITALLTVLPVLVLCQTCPTPMCTCITDSKYTDRVIDCRDKDLQQIPSFTPTTETFAEITFKKESTCSSKCNRITAIQDDAFANLTVQRIDMSGNALTTVTDNAFKGLENVLLKLDIEGDKSIAPPLNAMKNLTNLNILELRYFNLPVTGTDTFAEFPNLITLQLKDMNIDFIGQSTFVGKFPKLTTLKIISNEKLGNIPVGALRQLQTLEHLSLVQTKIPQVTAESFKLLTKLIELDLSHNEISVMDAECFAGLYDNLELLLLNINKIESDDLVAISTPSWKKLHQINLGQNLIHQIPNGLFSKMPAIAYVSLSWNQISVIEPADLTGLTDLDHLDISYNVIQTIEPGAFKQMTKLTQLDIEYNNENSQSKLNLSVASVQGLESSLHRLNLKYSSVLENELWGVISSLVNLKTLSLTQTGLTHVPDFTFQDHKSLSYLDLDLNSIDSVIQETFYGLETTLDSLNLQNNNISQISECVFKNFTLLHFFYLDNNPVHCDCQVKWIQERLKNPPTPGFILWNVACKTPSNLVDKSVQSIDSSLLVCDPGYTAPVCKDFNAQTTTETPTTTVIFPTITALSIQNSALFTAQVTWSVSDPQILSRFRVTHEANGGTKITSNPISKTDITYTLNNLASQTQYNVCLVMELTTGMSNELSRCETVTTLAEPTATLGVVLISEESIKISWSVTASTYIESFMIKYEELGDASTSKKFPVDKSNTQFTLEDLKSGISYDICIIPMLANNREGSPKCIISTTKEKPTTDTMTGSDNNAGIIAGAVVGCLVAIVIIIAIVYILLIRRGKPKPPPPSIQATSFSLDSFPQVSNNATRFVKTKPKGDQPGDAIQINSISSGKMHPDDPRISGGSYQFLSETQKINLTPSGSKMSGANGTTADLPPSNYNYINHGYGQQGGQQLKPTYVNDPSSHQTDHYVNDNDIRPLPTVPKNNGFTNLSFKKESPASSPTSPSNIYNEIPL